MKFEVCDPPLWQVILLWTAIIINWVLAYYNTRMALKYARAREVIQRMKGRSEDDEGWPATTVIMSSGHVGTFKPTKGKPIRK